jgi:hypothetical protein
MAKCMPIDQICFYDEFLKKQIEGSHTYDGKKIHGARSAPARFDGRFDQTAVDLLAQKALGGLARDAESKLARDAEMDSANSHSYKKAA